MPSITPLHSHHGDGTNDDDTSGANVAKATAMAVLFLCSFCLGGLPVLLRKWLTNSQDPKNSEYVKLLLGIGGGVLLCTTFMHLLPEVSETFEELNVTPGVQIHYAELLMCSGFFLMYLVEECVHVYLHSKEKESEMATLERSLSIRRGDSTVEKPKPDAEPEKQKHAGHSHVVVDNSDNSTVKTIRGLLIVLALSVHELFEGLSVGLEASASSVWYMFGAVAAHKLVIAFCIGVELVAGGLSRTLTLGYVFVFAVVSPMGIGIGMAVSNAGVESADMVSVILQGLATGTLLYVVFFEILQGERKSGLKQWLALFVGFAVMFGITLVGD